MQFHDDSDDVDFTRLLEEIPLLYKARAFAESLNANTWFSRLGEPLDPRDRTLARAYLDGLGFPEAEPALLSDWSEAATAAESLDRDPVGWEAEEMLRAGLITRVLERLDEEAVNVALSQVGSKTHDSSRDAVEEAASIDDIEDMELVHAAAGALAQAANGAALVIMAEAEDDDPPHPFLARWRLFARGRWPVGLAGASYNIL
ncbi:hypothetical protein [Maricaulis salignorans]|uniref:Uncharacterized protein n=1 Tax=Maricaulis salignorans TaxID=144026 RepID=A0A1G9R3C5_9PROT|nr:hypothetical protein [Maricaulis salignorans]SDM17631.1 hypothetical protein SAMN04488568_10647 [Maricaulis salignorans]